MNQNLKKKFKNIHIGEYLKSRVEEMQISQERIGNYLNVTDDEIQAIYKSESIDAYSLLRWSKLLEYDFFRLYSQHLILYAPPARQDSTDSQIPIKTNLPEFRKNIYTKEIIDFVLDLINTGQKTKQQIVNEYRIPKTTLYKWVAKHADHNVLE